MGNENKSRIYLAIEEFFNNYLLERDLEKTLACVSVNICSIGSGNDEIAFGKSELKQLLVDEFASIPASISYRLDSFKEKTIATSCYQAFAKLVTSIKLTSGVIADYCLRLTANLHDEDGKLLIDSLHVSEASKYQDDGEFFPFKYLSEGLRNISQQAKQDLFDIVTQIIPGGVVGGYDDDGFTFYTANQRFLDMLGCDSKEDFINSFDGKIINSIHPEDRKYVLDSISSQMDINGQYEIEYRMLKKNGEYFYVHDIGRKTLAKDGRIAIISVIIDISSKVRQTRGILRELYQDYLTGILNRKGAKKEMHSRMKDSTECLFLLIDLDNFKQVNDIYGHEHGDIVLQWLARKMKRLFASDVVYRLGGDEFGIYITGTDRINGASKRAFQLINDYRVMIERKYPQSDSSLSIGGICKKAPYQLQDLYRLVDEVLYEVKRGTKGQLIIKRID